MMDEEKERLIRELMRLSARPMETQRLARDLIKDATEEVERLKDVYNRERVYHENMRNYAYSLDTELSNLKSNLK